jgi:hypothetical protein
MNKGKDTIANFDTGDLPMRDLVDAIALPAFSSVEAVESMEKIVSKANEIKKAEREEMIMNFIMGLLCAYPPQAYQNPNC